MLLHNTDTHTKERRIRRNNPDAHNVLAMFTADLPMKTLALTFGTLLSSQGTDASFETVSPALSGLFPSFPTLSDPFTGLTPSQRGPPSRPFGRSDE